MKRAWHSFVAPFWVLAIACAWVDSDNNTASSANSPARPDLFDDAHFFAVSVVDSKEMHYHLVHAAHVDTLRLAADMRLFVHLRASAAAQAAELLKVAGDEASLASIPPDIDQLPVAAKKNLFFSLLYPIADFHNKTILARRARLQHLDGSSADETFLQSMAEHYALDRHLQPLPTRADTLRELLVRVDIIPPSLVLAQGAIESGWGTSRFARRGNNLFGQRIWRSDMAGLQAKGAQDARFRLAVYETVSASVRSYMRNLNSHPAYADLRALRADLRARGERANGRVLAKGLLRYSTRGEEYVRDVRRMIKGNKLERLDAGQVGIGK
jgi:Bax protein